VLVSRLASEHQSIAGYLACRICLAGMGTRHPEHGCMAYVGIGDDILLGSTATAAVSQRCGAHITRLQESGRAQARAVGRKQARQGESSNRKHRSSFKVDLGIRCG
jgi:hypothetical protein